MALSLCDWLDNDVSHLKSQSIRWLSENHFFRDPIRPVYSDDSYFFAPADGIIVYQREVAKNEPIVEIKGRKFCIQDAMHDMSYDRKSLVIGIFMTFYDVHVNRVPYSGRLSYRLLEPIDTHIHPMLDVEKHLLEDLRVEMSAADYLYSNQRILNRILAPALRQHYYVLQIADFDVDSILPFDLKQNQPVSQNRRFSQIRYGSQVDLIVPLSERFEFIPTQEIGMHVEAGIDTLIKITERDNSPAGDGRSPERAK